MPPGPASHPLPMIGAQLSAAGGLAHVVSRAREIGAEAVQIFSWNPRQWRPYDYSAADIALLRSEMRRAAMPLFVHTIYLVNLAGPDPLLRERSCAALAIGLAFAAAAGAAGVVTHIGSHRGDGFGIALPRVAEAIAVSQAAAAAAVADTAVSNPPRESGKGADRDLPPLLLEVSSGSGDSVGRDVEELSRLLTATEGSPGPVGICLDTAHLFAGGHPVHTPQGLEILVESLAERGCLDRLGLIHLNDCRSSLGSFADRHENLWDGNIGRAGLEPFVRHPAFRHVPFVLETPGLEGHGPDRENMRRAKLMRRRRAGDVR